MCLPTKGIDTIVFYVKSLLFIIASYNFLVDFEYIIFRIIDSLCLYFHTSFISEYAFRKVPI